MDRRWSFAALAVGIMGALAVAVFSRGDARRPVADWPKNFAHRGASLKAPENTLEAFRFAAKDGTGGLELDAHMTSDGHIIVIHDETVDRTTDGTGPVRDMTQGEIQNFDAGYHFTPDHGDTYPYRGKGVRVPELGEVLREFPDLKVNIDVKEDQPGVEAVLLKTITDADAQDRTLVVSELPAVLDRFRELAGGGKVSTGASRQEIEKFYLASIMHLEGSLNPSYEALQVPVKYAGREVVTPRFLEAAHTRGVRVDVWTIDDPEEMRRLLDLGVDTIMTNRPEILAEVLKERRY